MEVDFETMNVAMIGLTHPQTLDQLDEVTAVPLYDPDETVGREVAARFRKAAGVYTSLEDLLAEADITHALVAVRNDQSVPTLTRCIGAGKQVFTEKPAARTAAEFEAVIAALAQHPGAFGIAYLSRWHPAIRQMRELYQGQAIGRLTSVELRMVTTQVHFRNPRHWLFQREIAGGGILSWLGCHLIDLLRFVTGEEIASVVAKLATTSGEDISVEDTAAVSFRLANGAIGSLHAGYLLASGAAGYRGASYDRSVHLRGTEGSIAYRFDGPLVLESTAPTWGSASPRTYDFILPSTPGYGGRHGVDFVRAFLAAKPGDPTPAGAIDALRVLESLDAIYEADRTGATVDVPHRPVAVRDLV
jgi:predicted dehydrogenase